MNQWWPRSLTHICGTIGGDVNMVTMFCGWAMGCQLYLTKNRPYYSKILHKIGTSLWLCGRAWLRRMNGQKYIAIKKNWHSLKVGHWIGNVGMFFFRSLVRLLRRKSPFWPFPVQPETEISASIYGQLRWMNMMYGRNFREFSCVATPSLHRIRFQTIALINPLWATLYRYLTHL